MEKIVAWVAPNVNEFAGPKGTTFYVNVSFSDGEGGSLGKQDRDKAEALRNQLQELMGTPAEFTLEDRGKKTKEGRTSWVIKGFPGYEAPSFGGGGGGGGGSFSGGGARRSPEAQHQEQRQMHRRTALMQAVILSKDADEALAVADAFDAWLMAALPKPDAAVSLPPAVASPGAGSPSQQRPAPTSSAPAPAGGGQGMTWTAPRAEGEAADSGPSGSLLPDEALHEHTFQPAPRVGWLACSVCGYAKRATGK